MNIIGNINYLEKAYLNMQGRMELIGVHLEIGYQHLIILTENSLIYLQ